MPVKTRRGLLAGFLVVGLFALAVAVALALQWHELPPPAKSNRQQVLYWLATRDLSLESAETRLGLVRRIEEESLGGLRWADFGDELSPPYRERLWKNVPLLVGPWFTSKSDQYFSLPAEQRSAFLNKVLDLVELWRGMDVLVAPKTSSQGQGGGTFVPVLLQEVGRCVEQTTDPECRQQRAEFAMAMQMRWLARNLWGK